MKSNKKAKNNKSKQKKLVVLKPRKNQKIISSKNKYVQYLSDETKARKIEEKIKTIQKLPDFEKIHEMLNGKANKIKRLCKTNDYNNKRFSHWNTYSFLIKEINQCILENNWNNLTKFLFPLIAAPVYYQSFMLKAALINFTMNPTSINNDLLNNFLMECLACQNEDEMIRLLETQFCCPPDEKITISSEDDHSKLSTPYKLRRRSLYVSKEKYDLI